MPAKISVFWMSLLTLSSLVSNLALADSERALPDTNTTVFVSNRDVNRIECPVAVDDVLWSEERPVVVQQDGNRVFVKFKAIKKGMEVSYTKAPVDVHVVCEGSVYTLLLHPQPMDSKTIYLGSPQKAALNKVVKEWGGLPHEEQVKKLTLSAFRDDIPSGFKVTGLSWRRGTPLYRNLEIRPARKIVAPGLGLTLSEYVITAKEPLAFKELDFLNENFGDRIVGITVHPLVTKRPGDEVRLFVVEKGVSDE